MQYKELRGSQVIPLVMDKVDRVKSGHSARMPVTHVEGVQGLGKTRLVHDLSDQVRDTVADAVVVSIPGTHLRAIYKSHPPQIGFSAAQIEMLKQFGVQASRGISDETRRQIVRLGRDSDQRDVNETAFALGKDLASVSRKRPVTIFFDDQHVAPGDVWRARWLTAPMLDGDSRVVTINTSEKPFIYKLGSSSGDIEERVALQPLNVDEIAAAFNVEPQVAELYKKIANGIPYLVSDLDEQLHSSRDKKRELTRRFPHYAARAADVLASQDEVSVMNPRVRAIIDVLSCMEWFDFSMLDFALTATQKRIGVEKPSMDHWDYRELIKNGYGWLQRNTSVIRYNDDNKLSRVDPVAAPVFAQAFELRDPDEYREVVRDGLKFQESCLRYCSREDQYQGLESSVAQLRRRMG